MRRRDLLMGAAAGTAISALDWFRFFKARGVGLSQRELGIAEAAAAEGAAPRYLIYWFVEGGWDGYSLFNPLVTKNDALAKIGGSTAVYRPKTASYDAQGNYRTLQYGGQTVGHLGEQGAPLYPEMSIVSSHRGASFHSLARLAFHYGTYSTLDPFAARGADERSVLQAFAEENATSYLLGHISFHRWLADGELSEANYPEGTGYYERLGPPHAHTIYGGTPELMRTRLERIRDSRGSARDERIHRFVDGLYQNVLKDKHGESVRALDAAAKAHATFVSRGAGIDLATLFSDAQLRAEFAIAPSDEQTSSKTLEGLPARSKNSPNTNVQAMMAFELLTRGLSTCVWIETRDVRGFDAHRTRAVAFAEGGQLDQKAMIDAQLWAPLRALVQRLKGTQHPATGKTYWDHTTIVLASEMGRTLGGEDDDVSRHSDISSVAFLGAGVRGGTQFGRVGRLSTTSIPILPTGALDPNFDPDTGLLLPGRSKATDSFVPDAGHVYATALSLVGMTGPRGRNTRGPLSFVKK